MHPHEVFNLFGNLDMASSGVIVSKIVSVVDLCSGDWTQILGVFSLKGNIKAGMLSKLLLKGILLTEQAGLFIDLVSCDGATWNRSMWKSFGIGGMRIYFLFSYASLLALRRVKQNNIVYA